MLTKMKHYVPGYILYSLYCTLVLGLPYINYGILIWGNTCKTYLDNAFLSYRNGPLEQFHMSITGVTQALCLKNTMS